MTKWKKVMESDIFLICSDGETFRCWDKTRPEPVDLVLVAVELYDYDMPMGYHDSSDCSYTGPWDYRGVSCYIEQLGYNHLFMWFQTKENFG